MVRRPLGQKSIFMGSCAVQGSLFSTLASGSALKPLKSAWKGTYQRACLHSPATRPPFLKPELLPESHAVSGKIMQTYLQLQFGSATQLGGRDNATGMETYHEEIFAGDCRFVCSRDGFSRVCRRYGREGGAGAYGGSDLRLDRLLHWRQWWLGPEP